MIMMTTGLIFLYASVQWSTTRYLNVLLHTLHDGAALMSLHV